MGKTTITLRCAACGGDQFERPGNPKAEDKVTCAGCGATGTYGQLMQSAKKQVMDQVTADLRKSFKGIKGFSVK